MKKLILGFWCCSFLLFAALLMNYVQNEKMIEHFQEGIVRESDLSKLGMIQPYIYYYNKGNICYEQGEYEQAAACYQKSLECSVPEGRECAIRINLALAMVTPIDMENINADNRDDMIGILESARQILVEEGCADMEDDYGHSVDAQTLKNEIDVYLEVLKNPQEEATSKEEQEKSEEQETSEEERDTETAEQEELEKQYEEMEQKGMNERNQNLEDYKNFDNFQYYDGACW